MSGDRDVDLVRDLRTAFDASFAAAPVERVPQEDLLEIRVGDVAYMVRLRELSGVLPAMRVSSLPVRLPALLGVAALGTSVVAVYDLRVLVGDRERAEAPRWFARPAAAAVALAFDAVVGHRRVPVTAIVPGVADDRSPHAAGVVTHGGGASPLLSIASVTDAIARLVGETPVGGMTRR